MQTWGEYRRLEQLMSKNPFDGGGKTNPSVKIGVHFRKSARMSTSHPCGVRNSLLRCSTGGGIRG